MDLKNILKTLKLNESTISMLLGALVIVVVVILLVNFFRGLGEEETTKIPPGTTTTLEEQVRADLPTTHAVEQGENLWTIAERYYGSGYNWVDVAQANDIAAPDLIEVGQEFSIPDVPSKNLTVDLALTAEATIFGPPIQGDSYTVVEGDHLWGIAVRAYGDGYRWSDIARDNAIANPDIVNPGQNLVLLR